MASNDNDQSARRPRVLWFRRDLRVHDHPALLAAASGAPAEKSGEPGGPVLGVFVIDPALLAGSGGPRTRYLAGCLTALSESIGGRLAVLFGDPIELLPRVARAIGAPEVHVTADFGPYGRRRDERVAAALAEAEVDWVPTGSPYAVTPGRVTKADGTGYAVFTPYHRAWIEHGWRSPARTDADTASWVDPSDLPRGLVEKDWKARLAKAAGDVETSEFTPAPGEESAKERWQDYRAEDLADYEDVRDRPDLDRTSRISAALKWGTVHPRSLLSQSRGAGRGPSSYRRELAWREFYADLVFRRPDSVKWSIDPAIDAMEWDTGAEADRHFEAWASGRTGFPYIDAGMRQLLAEGWMHNRVRMAVASFLIKDLHLPWQRGAAHFMDHLIDGDAASNSHGWQWSAGAGPQAAPFFRIMHPLTQGERHDPDGHYVRRYVPELADIRGKAVHKPWLLPGGVPAGYLEPIVDHATERAEALRRYGNRPKPS